LSSHIYSLDQKFSIDIGSEGFVHQVIVGEDDSLLFTPNRLNANIGDQITFSFRGLNHTLTQSSLENPCSPLPQFDTGFGQFNPQQRNDISITLTVNTLEPQWFFCKQNDPLSHCHAGMVFAINPGDKMEQFKKNARRASLAPRPAWSSSFAGSASRSKSPSSPTGLEITPVTPVAGMTTSAGSRMPSTSSAPTVLEITPVTPAFGMTASDGSWMSSTSSASSMGQSGAPTQSVVIITKTVTKECPSAIASGLITATPSSLKRNASIISAASPKASSGIGRKLGGLVLGFLLFQLR
jgi:plastocyanin